MKQLSIRPRADQDIDHAIHYLSSEDVQAASDFIDALESGLQMILEYPEIGSPRYQHILPVDGLRFWKVGKFEWLILYFVSEERVDVVRVVHGAQDISSRLDLGN